MRLFVSVDLPDALAEPVADVQAPLEEAPGISPTDPGQAHVTLKFLGEVPEHELESTADAVAAGVEDAAVESFEVAVEGLGVFPSLEYISVVWLGIDDGSTRLTDLHEAVEDRTVAAGFDPEDHEFTPHVTIGRMEHAGGKEHVQRLVRERDPDVGRFEATEVRLTRSDLTEAGPEYSTVEAFEL